MTAKFKGFSFSPHRHDTYAIGITTDGVQAFTYRGEGRRSTKNQVFVLHPDERHDGRSGDDCGFGYRIAYIDPSLILAASEGKDLPFVREPVLDDERLYCAVREVLSVPDDVTAEFATACNVAELSDALSRFAVSASRRTAPIDFCGVRAARDALLSATGAKVSISDLEKLSGMSRWQLARQFRQVYGVSPYRFHRLRRLAHARDLLMRGQPLADISLACGFADQAHMSRQFKDAYGVSPGRWRVFLSRVG